MKTPLRKITIIFILASILPIVYVVFEIGSLNRNEQMVREIYKNQLDAILYSVNQYSNVIVSSWTNGVRADIRENRDSIPQTKSGFSSSLSESWVIEGVYFSDLKEQNKLVNFKLDTKDVPVYKTQLDDLVDNKKQRLQQISRYFLDAGYRKNEAADTIVGKESLPIYFALDSTTSTYKVAILLLNMNVLVQDILGPKMQHIAQEKFVMSAFSAANDSLIYSTEINSDLLKTKSKDWQRREFWLLPGYYLGISSKVLTIEDLVRERTNTSLVILGLLMLSLAVGAIFLYRTLTRQMQLSQAKAEFVSNVSHEIRTPLALISMFAETLEMGRVRTEEKKNEYYSIINKETHRLSRIVDRILSFSQIDADKKRYNFKTLNINDVCREVMDSYSFHLKNKGFEYELTLDEELQSISGDHEAIAEAMINLLDNAIKYSPDVKEIKVRTIREDKFVILEVQDQGLGIAKNHQSDIFDQFYRVPTGDVHDIKGSGLGLSLLKKIMEAHGGDIKLVSELGKGSTFKLYFPIKQTSTNEL